MKSRTTKHALVLSLLALVMCLSMLIGTTFAWFTDTVTSDVNKIVAGNLDIELYHTNKVDTDEKVEGDTVLFDDIALWEPGAVVFENFELKNEGTLALKYEFSLLAENETVVNGKSIKDALQVAVIENGIFTGNRENAKALTYEAFDSFTLAGTLEAGASTSYAIVIYWEPTADDNVFNMNNGATTALTVDLGVELIATQLASEEDSFNNQYDLDASFPRPGYVAITSTDDVNNAITNAQAGDVVKFYLPKDTTLNEPIVIDEDVTVEIDLDGKTLSGNTGALIKATEGNIIITNGTIKNTNESGIATLSTSNQRYGIQLSGDVEAIITNVEIETIGTGLFVTGNAKVTELNAKITGKFADNGGYSYSAILLDGNGRIDLISGGEYISMRTPEFITLWYDTYHATGKTTVNEIYSFALDIISSGASVGEIAGGTFMSEMDKANNGAAIHVNCGTIEKISGGYFGFSKLGLSNPIRLIFVNTNNGASIGQVVGGTFEVGTLNNGFGCDFAGIVNASGCSLVDTGETLEVKAQFTSSLKTYTVKVYEVVNN